MDVDLLKNPEINVTSKKVSKYMKSFLKLKFKKEMLDPQYPNKTVLFVEPLERGFSITFGNALRRILLSSIPGLAIYGFRMPGFNQEFSTIPGIIEPLPKIVLNFKKVILKPLLNTVTFDEKIVLHLNLTNHTGPVYAKDIICPDGISIINEDLLIANVSKATTMNVELYARYSRGFKTFIENKSIEPVIGVVTIDSNFSPIVSVNCKTEITKIGKIDDLEQLILEIETNGAIEAMDALGIAVNILKAHLDVFEDVSKNYQNIEVFSETEVEECFNKDLNKRIEELGLSIRSFNCLKKIGVETLKELIDQTEDEVKLINNLGKKSFLEIKDKLIQLNLFFRKV